ncbi:transketolase [Fistulifera solaris]|uniref:transketolase n=1 Tax=Fistulifera solaris TaxID=1519565 RepID=A0A1Z5JWY9_FISSO|nr:transketolase [Fistulifera solaris]|eukprot:GAX18386.1 transketolase [Fistulifera solaris]
MSFELKCVNTIRAISADQPEAANAGHPGAPMGCAPMAYALWGEVMKYSSKDPAWIDRDRFVLSNGHACALQYSMLHLTGYDVSIDDLKNFRKIGFKTPGHPECFQTPGVEVCTGPLGQGISNAVGLAIAERHLAAQFNETNMPVFDHYTYVICGDGCLQEGVSGEACSLAGHLGLGKLIVLYDDNEITIDGETSLSFTEDVLKRYEAYGWHTQRITDVEESVGSLLKAIESAKSVTDKPSIIKVKTMIGYGSPGKQGKEEAHGAPLGKEELRKAKEFYGLPPDEMFYIPDDVQAFFSQAAAKGEAKRKAWEEMFAQYAAKFPEKAAELSRRMAGKLPEGLIERLPRYEAGKDKDAATRKYSHGVLGAIGPNLPELVGGSADLTPSNLTDYQGVVDFQQDSPDGRYIRFGVREHGMVAVCNGLFAHGCLRPYCATFLIFTGYCVGAIRLSALSKFGVIFVMTHDSIGLGEDGPTHQPVETLEMLRSIPNLNVFRPGDGNETSAAYQSALEHRETPTVIALSRSTVMAIPGSSIEKALKGAYVAQEVDNPVLIVVATGSEVGPSLKAASALTADGVPTAVVSMPCQEVFLAQPESYQRSILPGNIPTLAVEASAVHGWHRFCHSSISIGTFGMSGPGDDVMKLFGYSVDNIAQKGRDLVDFYKGRQVPDLSDRPKPDMLVNGH